MKSRKQNPVINPYCYAAIRQTQDSEKEWIDPSTIECLLGSTREKAEKLDKQIPSWAKVNPVVRFTRIEIREIAEE